MSCERELREQRIEEFREGRELRVRQAAAYLDKQAYDRERQAKSETDVLRDDITKLEEENARLREELAECQKSNPL